MARYKLVYSPESLQEINHIVDYYNQASKGLGGRFKKNLLAAIATVKKNPFGHSVRYDDVRFAVAEKFPYAAHYTIDADNHLIKIQAIFSFDQDSEANWKVRF
jgi:plasmid stabilization system protein ParE